MAHTLYTGKEVKITFGAVTKRFRSLEVSVTRADFDAQPSDSDTVRRGSGPADATMTIVGFDSDDANAGDFAEIAALVLSRTAPSALSWTDDDATPASKLPADFFTTYFPLADWRVTGVTGGSGGPSDPGQWSATLTPNHDD
jgi:hypothetical protein